MKTYNKKRLFEIMTKVGPNFNNNVYYHGSNNKFGKFDLYNNKTYREFDLPVWFFTKNIDYAKTYGKYLYKVKLNIKNIFDTSNPKHFKMFIDYMKDEKIDKNQINKILDEQFYKDLPYWTCENAYYAAVTNKFDSILIQEELENEILSIGVFDKNHIEIMQIITI